MSEITLGFDPEFQVLDPQKKPVLASEVGFEPAPVHKSGCISFRDGANVELNGTAHTCRESMTLYFARALQTALGKLPPGYTLGSMAAFPVKKKSILNAPYDVKQFGCKPSKDAYTGKTKVPSLDGERHLRRYAGGHMHLSVRNVSPEAWRTGNTGRPMPPDVLQTWKALGDPETQMLYVKLLDWMVGVPCTYLWDDAAQFQRRKWYGQAGEYRSQLYGGNTAVGVEYRVPPPQVFNHNSTMSLFFGVARHVARNFDHYAKNWSDDMAEPIQAAINKGKEIEKNIVAVPGFYSLDTLKALKKRPEIHSFQIDRREDDALRGWNNTYPLWKIPVPAFNFEQTLLVY